MEQLQIPDKRPTLPGHLSNASLMDLKPYMDISVRACNVCDRYDLLQISDLLAFYLKELSFSKLKNAGKKTTDELEKICHWLLEQPDSTFVEILPSSEESQRLAWVREIAPANLSKNQINLLNAYVRQWHTALSVRPQTALSNLFLGNVDYATLHHAFFEKKIQASQIRNVGKKSFHEIEEFVERLRITAEGIRQQSDESLEGDLVADQLCQSFFLTHHFIEPYLPDIRAKRFPLFRFLRDLIFNYDFFDERQAYILRARSGWFRVHEVVGLDIIGQQLGITRERVRQIAINVEEKVMKIVDLLHTQKNTVLQITGSSYRLDTSRDLLLVRKQLVNDINHLEGTEFSSGFFALVFASLHADTHLLFGRQFNFFQNKYLLCKDLMEGFDAEAFVKSMKNLTEERIKEDFSLDLEGYLLKFVKPGQPSSTLLRARAMATDLLMLEFSEKVRLEPPNELIICRNAKHQAWEYAFEALESIGAPAKLHIIYKAIVEKYPDFEPNAEALRGILTKERYQFISFSRTSTYGLAKWEAELDDIRGGTIRDIVEEYLLQCDQPQHCHDIANFVLRYRPSSSAISIHGNLQLDESERFVHFGQYFWGLAMRDYGDFQAQPMSNHALTYFKNWLNVYPDGSEEEAIEHLSKRCQVLPIQIKAWLADKIRNGTLRLERDKLTIIR